MSAKRILVTEDDPSIRRLLATILRRAKYEVDTASNGHDAIEKTKKTDYDVIVLDLMMPVMSGFEVLERLAVRAPKPRFVVILSAAPHDAIARAGGANVFATLHKPSAIHEILATVDACIAAP
ncbi:MAG: two-component system, NtrC family, nitrogen regulation response regulator NtrX [Thermoanaerobaculia bacterium]|jgi:DNA-binding response OmpR family regulator|nr:two-component system, NtrC family, nitrogen regulation response regulator NtrX [Thermoanaerobaculia bacterium]MEA2416057.1 two-component system, NtrC family, nitrogen regulation response regulator NtrX [Thermoanaerobaculia bacterium]